MKIDANTFQFFTRNPRGTKAKAIDENDVERFLVFAKENGPIRKKIGNPDLLILFTNTVSHKMVLAAAQEAKRNNIPVARIHTSSAAALKGVLNEYCA